MGKAEVKKQQEELKKLVQKTFNEIRVTLKKRTAYDYQQDIFNNYKLNSLQRLYETFEKLIGLPKEGQLTKADVNKILTTKVKDLIAENILSRQLNEKTRDTPKGTRKKKERKALGEKFKEIYIYAEDIDGLNGFDIKAVSEGNEWNKQNLNLLSTILSNRLTNEYERIISDKTAKYSVKGYVVIKCLLTSIEGGGDDTKYFCYNSDITDVVSKNQIKEYINNVSFYTASTSLLIVIYCISCMVYNYIVCNIILYMNYIIFICTYTFICIFICIYI